MDRIKPSATFAMTPEQIERLRDEFAMAALTGLCADPGTGGHTNESLARTCYALANAMLKAREEG